MILPKLCVSAVLLLFGGEARPLYTGYPLPGQRLFPGGYPILPGRRLLPGGYPILPGRRLFPGGYPPLPGRRLFPGYPGRP